MMRFNAAALTIALACFAPTASWADSEETESAPETNSVDAAPPVSAAPPLRVIYKPPSTGKPVRSVGGGSRGTIEKIPALFTVTPDHIGQTISEQPSLFWYIDRVLDPSIKVEFTLLDEDGVDPLIETSLATPDSAGVHRIRLSDFDAKLVSGRNYEWSVALIIDPDKRAKDIVATGWIDRVEGSDGLAARVASNDGAASAAVYAEEGLWYDSFGALSDLIEDDPSDAQLLRQRQDVLRQVGLEVAAAGVDG
jgi:hypothetical protein